MLVAAFPLEVVGESDGRRERGEEPTPSVLVEAVEDPWHIGGGASHSLAPSHVPGETTPVCGAADGLDEGKGVSLFVVEVAGEHRLELTDEVAETISSSGQRVVYGVEERLELAVLALHVVEKPGGTGASGGRPRDRGP